MRLLELMQRTNYELVQVNGQRWLTTPEVTAGQWKHSKGTEMFLDRLPRDCCDCCEDELEQVSRFLELRLMLDFSGRFAASHMTRGYAFASYETPRIAREACVCLNGYEIRPGHRIGVVKSMDNCRLFFDGVPKNTTKAAIVRARIQAHRFMAELTKMLHDITDIYLYPSAHDHSLNRGFIFIEFKNHRAAAMARRKLILGKVTLWDHEIVMDWADPEPGEPIDENIMESFEFPLKFRLKELIFAIAILFLCFHHFCICPPFFIKIINSASFSPDYLQFVFY
ncbi:unnamed protein product [Lasius platythorax]|uniref:RRM domain-containing protein n=1 Tax=Lasius platythorax TaxID=488582 RepID=A0AAV2NYJ5_9HYME